MKNNYYKLLIKVANYTFIGMFCQFFIAGLCIANDADAQKVKSIEEVGIEARYNEASLAEIFRDIESQTDFVFTYDKKDSFLKERYTNDNGKTIVADLLRDISSRKSLIFQQINNNISVRKKLEIDEKLPEPIITAINVTGTVTSPEGEPLPGVNIMVKNTSYGTVTDLQGYYTLEVEPDANLIFSFIGYQPKEVAVNGRSVINVELGIDVQTLEEIVVVGFGEQKKATVTGAISSVGTKELVQSPQANISNALVGRMPGLMAVQRSGEPGNDQSTLRIRGVGTFAGSQEPLVMVDGIETPNYNNIDPNEIESITILKDASATAVYGVRGANGVILITTKRGEIGPPQVSFSSNMGISSFVDLRKNMGSYDYARSQNQARMYDSYFTGGYTPRFTDEAIEKYRTQEDPIFYPDTDWVDLMLKDNSEQNQYNLNFRGGTEKLKYFVSAGHFNQEGLFETSNFQRGFDPQIKYKRYNFRANFDVEITERFSANIDVSTQIENQNRFNWSTGLFMNSLLSSNPVSSPGLIDGKIVYNDPLIQQTPLVALNSGYKAIKNNFLNGSVRLNYDLDLITQGLSIHGTVSYKNFNSMVDTYDNVGKVSYLAKKLPDESIVYVPSAVPAPFHHGQSVDKRRNTYAETGINYNRRFGLHAVTGLLLYNQSTRFDPDLAFLVPNSYQGLVSRFTYGYDSRYLAEFNLGYNGTENFAPGKRFGFFPAYSLGWVASEEPFFPENEIVTFLKFRGSYGEVGNDKVGGARFLYRPTPYLYTGEYYWGEVGSTYNRYQSSTEGKIGNPDLTWERAKKTDIGLELGLWKDKIYLTVDWFREHRDNILTNKGTIPALVGADLPAYNLGEMENSGFDGEITFDDTAGSVSYWLKGNFTYAHNEVLFQDEVTRPFSYQYRTGQAFGQQFGYIAEGLYNTWEEVNDVNRPVYMWDNDRVQPGDVKYKDINGDGRINQDDQVPIGYSSFPEKIFGFSFGGNFKGFDFSVLFQGATNVTVFPSGMSMRGFKQGRGGAPRAILDNSWTQERYELGLPINYPRLSELGSINYQNSTYWQEDASYVRLKNAEIGYMFTNTLLNKAGLESARIYVNGSNLVTWDSMLPGEDPEFPPSSSNSEPYPITRIINLGVNIQF